MGTIEPRIATAFLFCTRSLTAAADLAPSLWSSTEVSLISWQARPPLLFTRLAQTPSPVRALPADWSTSPLQAPTCPITSGAPSFAQVAGPELFVAAGGLTAP